jgi:2-polyprenyl-3-methyl-5-hydroxy-6-metoxy-1,4-benzoquinol methylase
MTLATPEENKKAYGQLHDRITDKRFHSPSPIRQHAHHMQYAAVANQVPAGATVLDAGCGEGTLSVLLAKRGCIVTGVDLSEPNIAAAKAYAQAEGVADRVTFLVGDAEHLPVQDKSFDYVVSSHVLEHLPEFSQGVREIARIARVGAVIAIPTCLNACSLVLLGGDKYWAFSRRTPYALLAGICRVIGAYVTGQEGVNEGYAGRSELIHIWRFPRRGRMLLEGGGLNVKRYRASSFVLPYFSFLLPLSKMLEKGVWLPVLRNCGYGTTYVCTPKP